MDIKIKKINIFSKNGEESEYNFADSLTFIYGNVGTGKTTLLNLIMYCLGKDFVKTSAVNVCLEAVQLEVILKGRICRLFRKINSKRILVEDLKRGHSFRLSNIEVSDFIFTQCELSDIYQATGFISNKKIKLSFTNFLWFSFLEQNEMDNNIFQLNSDNIFKQNAAENVLLSLLQSDILIDGELNEKYRTLKRKIRQYEEGKEIFEYLDKDLVRNDTTTSLLNKKNMIQNLITEIHNLKEKKQFFTFGEVELLLEQQELLNKLEYQYLYETKKTRYFDKLEDIRDEMADIEQRLKQNVSLDSVCVSQICDLFLENLIEIGFKGISKHDKVVIDGKRHYMPVIYNRYNRQEISFLNLGSGGKKTLFKICFALSLYRFYANIEDNNYLPTFLIIDTPMKNISEREDKEMYIRFYKYLFRLFSTELKNIQLIIVDKEGTDLTDYAMKNEAFLMRMSWDNPLNPPLFFGYKGL